MMKIAVLCKDGFEELEALGIVDMARRMKVTCDIVGFGSDHVHGGHGIDIKADKDFGEMDDSYDAVVIPGGMPGATNLRDDKNVTDLVKNYYDNGKIVAAICAGPIVLEKAGVLEGQVVTCYPGFEDQLTHGNYKESIVQVDGKVITAKGPAATFAFAFAILEALGLDTKSLQDGVQYTYLKNNI